MGKFKVGDSIIYINGDEIRLGIIKRPSPTSDAWFVWYHTGDTASCTNERDMHVLTNAYAFTITRKTPIIK